jgi:hypothetical protein
VSAHENGAALLPALAPKSITQEDLGRIPPAAETPETSGADAARAAAGGPEEPKPGLGSFPEDSAPPLPSGAAAVMFVDMVLALSVQLAAQRSKVPFRECAALAKLTADERALLEQFAPYAAPYLGAVGEASPIVGALAFAGVTFMVVSGRFRDVRALAPTPAKPPSSGATISRAAPPPGARVVDLEHTQRWGAIADVVPPGTQVVDTGKFPEPPKEEART